MPDEAIPAATLIVVREAAGGPPELLMVERAQGMAFAAGALVFPGGRIDDADRHSRRARRRCRCRRRDPRNARGNSRSRSGLSPLPIVGRSDRASTRARRGRAVRETTRRARLRIDAGALTPFARWVPKFHAVRRFDTLFFVARCPPGEWQPRVVEGECAGALWVTATEVLERERARRGASDLPDPANARTARSTLQLRRHPRRRACPPDRAGDALGRGARRREIHHHPGASRLPGDARNGSTASGEAEAEPIAR